MPAGSVSRLVDFLQREGRISYSDYCQAIECFGLRREQRDTKDITHKAIHKLTSVLVKERVILEGLWK